MYHCINCGSTWGGDIDIGSHGICPDCFAAYINEKKRIKGVKECFGEYKCHSGVDCMICSVKEFCKEYYEFERNLSR
jgi:hypothetical protein